MHSSRKHIIQLLFCFAICSSALAQQSSLIESMLDAYQELNYERAEAYAREILATYQAYPLSELTQVHTTLGIIKYTKNNQMEARQQFEAALSLSPDLALDPVFVSPKILTFFDEVKLGLTEKQGAGGEDVQVRYIMIEDLRSSAAMRSMAFPGWGQFYKGERKKGVLLMGLWGVSVSSTIIAHISRQEASRQYSRAREPVEIASRYDTYNQRNKIRNGLAIVAAGVWAYSYFDALVKPVHLQTANGKASLALQPASSYPYTQLRFVYSF